MLGGGEYSNTRYPGFADEADGVRYRYQLSI